MIKSFFKFGIEPDREPGQRVSASPVRLLVYASDMEEARAKVHSRMNEDYGKDCWKFVESMTKACEGDARSVDLSMSPGLSLLSVLNPSDCAEYLRDRADEEAKIAGPTNKRLTSFDEACLGKERSLRQRAVPIDQDAHARTSSGGIRR
jgi:hypothetical protein